MQRKPVSKKTLHAAIRKAVKANGGKRVPIIDFVRASGLRYADVFRNYAKWEQALRAAGFRFPVYASQAGRGLLLAEWGRIVRKLRRLPTQTEYRIHAPRYGIVLARQFGSWHHIPAAFRRFARRAHHRAAWVDVLKLLATLKIKTPSKPRKPLMELPAPQPPPTHPENTSSSPSSHLPETGNIVPLHTPNHTPPSARRMRDRPIYADHLNLPTLRHAPSNELGVIYLFGILAAHLGFSVERIQCSFPDCKAKRLTGRSIAWQDVLIEFEYASRNFKAHRHDPKGCDIIVCWEHNWPECPKNIEVIALSEEVKRLTGCNTLPPR